MTSTKISMLAATTAVAIATQPNDAGAQTCELPVANPAVADLLNLSLRSNDALMRGDIETYRSLITLSDDFTLFSPFGGKPTRGGDMTPESWNAMGRFFRNGSMQQELVQAYASEDMVVLALIERNHGEVGGLSSQDWMLRVTLVYRRVGDNWVLAHRHADPLVRGVSLQDAAALAR